VVPNDEPIQAVVVKLDQVVVALVGVSDRAPGHLPVAVDLDVTTLEPTLVEIRLKPFHVSPSRRGVDAAPATVW